MTSTPGSGGAYKVTIALDLTVYSLSLEELRVRIINALDGLDAGYAVDVDAYTASAPWNA